MIQLRHVPDDLHQRLKARAAAEGLSLSDYCIREMRRAVSVPSPAELRDRVSALEPLSPAESPADAVRAGRGDA